MLIDKSDKIKHNNIFFLESNTITNDSLLRVINVLNPFRNSTIKVLLYGCDQYFFIHNNQRLTKIGNTNVQIYTDIYKFAKEHDTNDIAIIHKITDTSSLIIFSDPSISQLYKIQCPIISLNFNWLEDRQLMNSLNQYISILHYKNFAMQVYLILASLKDKVIYSDNNCFVEIMYKHFPSLSFQDLILLNHAKENDVIIKLITDTKELSIKCYKDDYKTLLNGDISFPLQVLEVKIPLDDLNYQLDCLNKDLSLINDILGKNDNNN